MKKIFYLAAFVTILISCRNEHTSEEHDEYDNPEARAQLEAEKIKDPALGYVPYTRLLDAINYTEAMKQSPNRSAASLTWVERGPIYDSIGPSNGNIRGATVNGPGTYTSGRMRAFLLDTLNDPSGNTALASSVAGGIWRCTNFLSAVPNWTPINDYFDNLSIASICQNKSNPSIIYFATGEATANADAVNGRGVWKSTNGGLTFSWLPGSANFVRNFKIDCDAAGNLYLATRAVTVPVNQPFAMVRSNDGGATWENITPNNLTANAACTDFEFTSTGRLNAVFGYLGAVVNHRYTDNPATVTTAGWSSGSGFRVSGTAARRTEMAVLAQTLYAVTINTSNNADSCYKSTDGGQSWTLQNTTIMPSALSNGQGWYNHTLAINPGNEAELICGGLDAYRSTNSGQTWSRLTFWVGSAPYVHADHHYLQYWVTGGQTRIIMGGDGGLFYSTNNGATFTDKNRNLAIKQFYSVAIHPTAGSPYLLAGSQDNGVHQLKYPGLGPSIEVTGGDGMFVHINQQNPQIQFGSYVYNNYRRSTNGGATWTSINFGNTGLFVNPFDYDDVQNIMYACNGSNGAIRRWDNANAGSTSTILNISAAGTSTPTAFHVSPYTPNRVFVGTNNGRLLRLDNASTVTAATIDANITSIGGSFPSGFLNCVSTGTDDNNLLVVFSNYGVNNVWITTNGGTSWTAIDGNLPDMPVRWGLFEPGRNDRIYLATEAGVYYTDFVNGSSTVWTPEVGFPTVRTDMLKIRKSDSTIAAGTHGRGVFTAKIQFGCSAVTINSQPQSTSVCAGSNASFSVSVSGTNPTYQWQVSTNGGISFVNIPGATGAILNLSGVTAAMNNNRYRCVVGGGCTAPFNSNTAILNVNASSVINTQPFNVAVCENTSATFSVDATGASLSYQWQVSNDGGVSYININGANAPSLNLTGITAGMNNNRYRCIVSSACSAPITSNAGILTVNTAPRLINAPQNVSACPGSNHTFSVSATGTAIIYQWQVSNDGGATYSNLGGQTAANLTITNITAAQNNYRYRCIISGTCSPSVITNAAILSVKKPVEINSQPQQASVCMGRNTSFTVNASGDGIAYQWQVSSNGGSSFTNISGATQSTYNLTAVQMPLNNNLFRCVITGDCNTIISTAALLIVNPLPTIQLGSTPFTSLFPGLTTNLTATVTAPTPVSFVWYKNNTIIPGANTNSLTINIDGLGEYKTVVTDANGCVNTSGVFRITDSVTSKLFLYPNPNIGLFNVRYYATEAALRTIRIFDAQGRLVYRRGYTVTGPYDLMQVNMKGYGRGVYLLVLEDQSGRRIQSAKVVVQ